MSSGFVKGGQVIYWGDNLALQGEKPSGMAGVGQVIYRAAYAPWKLLTTTNVGGTATSATLTTSPIDTTGARLLILTVSTYEGSNTSVSDNQNNGWVEGAAWYTGTQGPRTEIYYCMTPVTSTAHTFTLSSVYGYGNLFVYSFDGPSWITFDQSKGAGTSTAATTLQVPALTPSAANSLLLSSISTGSYDQMAVDSGFIAQTVLGIAATRYGGGAAYLLKGAAAAISPTWTITNPIAAGASAAMVNFIPSPASPWHLLSTGSIATPGASPPLRTVTLNTTGANLLIIVTCGNAITSLYDNLNNTWTAIPPSVSGFGTQQFYCINPTTSSNHVFTFLASYSCCIVLAFKGPSTLAFDQSALTPEAANNQPVTVGPITPSTANSLLVSGIAINNDNLVSIDSGFKVANNVLAVAGQLNAGAAAYLVQGSPAPISPTWTVGPSAAYTIATMLCFKSS